ncbi:MAG TPA: HupE/UreJ family protein [Caldimonas sp.]|nr:HupE/UreJ family protein [Caldimonas sp.]
MRDAVRRALRALVAFALLTVVGAAGAHKASDSYLQVSAEPGQLDVRWDIALRDLDVALDLDSDADGKLTWGEVRAAWPRIEDYALHRLAIEGCPLAAVGRALERRNDGAYAVLTLRSSCTLAAGAPRISYGLFAEVDPTHRGIAKVQRPGQGVALSVLEPSAAMTAVASLSASAPSGGASGVAASRPAGASSSDAASRPPASGARWQFLLEGVRHILTGYDHVLFLLCLLLPSVMRRSSAGWQPVDRMGQAAWPVVGIVSAFTVAHSITLGLAALKLISLTPAFIEPAIAATIVLAALDNVLPIFPVRRVVVTFFFGLVHGFGFAGVLAELNLPRADFAWALLQFNLGLEVGQLVIVAVATSVLFGLRRWRGYPKVVIGAGSAIAIAIGVAWLIERIGNVSILPF